MPDSSSSKDSPPNESSNDSTDFDSSTSSKDTESPPPPDSESESPPPPPPKLSSPSDNSESPPSRPPPPPPQSSSPPSPPPPSKSPPPSSSNISPPPPDSSSSPPPPEDGESFSPPPPKSSSPPPEEEKAPPPPPSTSNLVFAPPPKGQSPSPTNATVLSKISPPPPPAVTVPPPPPPSKSSSVIVPLVPASTPPPPSPTIQNLSPPKTGNQSTPETPTPKTNAASTPVKPSPSTQSGASTSTPRSTTSSSSSKPPQPKVQSDKFHVDQSVGPIIGVTLLVVLLSLLAIFFVMVMRKKKKMDKMYYRPPPNSVSVRSDGYYYRTANSNASSSHSGSYYASQQMSSTASGIMYDSNRGYGHFQGPPDPTGSRSCFTYEELMDITHGFAQENVIGEGGFGCVYKGVLPDGRRVAVKQLKAGSGQGEREFRAEVEIISRVHHRHLVSLVGYCIADYHRLLVYEFVPNGTLEHHLHGKGLPVMEWSKRLKIAIGSARGLAYLHEDCHPRIIHRDIKSANILLDNCFEAQVADFGLAKLSNDANTHISTRVMGTFGYMAPEYASSGKLTDRSDVFSFGVVLLELITGRKPVDASQPLGDESLVEWARPLLVHAIESGNFNKLVDPRLEDNYAKPEMSRMIEAAAACVRHSAPKRPRMVQVVRALDTDGDMTDLTNGVKVGQSQVFNSGQYSADIRKFRQLAFASGEYESSEYGYSGDLNRRSAANSGELRPNSLRPVDKSPSGYSSSQDSETCAIYRRDRNSGGGNYRHSGRGFP